jgi:hypothetical protein
MVYMRASRPRSTRGEIARYNKFSAPLVRRQLSEDAEHRIHEGETMRATKG